MGTLGLYVRIAGGRYRVGFALVEDGAVTKHASLPAPAGEAEERQLDELFSRARDIVLEWGPDRASLWVSEVMNRATAARSHRAEGVLMAAASAAACSLTLFTRQRLANHAPGSGSTAAGVVDVLCDQLAGVPETEEERRAAAVAHGRNLDTPA